MSPLLSLKLCQWPLTVIIRATEASSPALPFGSRVQTVNNRPYCAVSGLVYRDVSKYDALLVRDSDFEGRGGVMLC